MFVAVAAMISFILASIRTLGNIKWIAWVGVVCVFIAGMGFRVLTSLQR